eukprot:COSAG01_NODE_1577_length_9847_cov_11.543394_2_plen_73_part_00
MIEHLHAQVAREEQQQQAGVPLSAADGGGGGGGGGGTGVVCEVRLDAGVMQRLRVGVHGPQPLCRVVDDVCR